MNYEPAIYRTMNSFSYKTYRFIKTKMYDRANEKVFECKDLIYADIITKFHPVYLISLISRSLLRNIAKFFEILARREFMRQAGVRHNQLTIEQIRTGDNGILMSISIDDAKKDVELGMKMNALIEGTEPLKASLVKTPVAVWLGILASLVAIPASVLTLIDLIHKAT